MSPFSCLTSVIWVFFSFLVNPSVCHFVIFLNNQTLHLLIFSFVFLFSILFIFILIFVVVEIGFLKLIHKGWIRRQEHGRQVVQCRGRQFSSGFSLKCSCVKCPCVERLLAFLWLLPLLATRTPSWSLSSFHKIYWNLFCVLPYCHSWRIFMYTCKKCMFCYCWVSWCCMDV